MTYDQDGYTPKDAPDPNDRRESRPPLPRLWPWVLAGMVVAALVWVYQEPIPHLSKPEPMVYQVP